MGVVNPGCSPYPGDACDPSWDGRGTLGAEEFGKWPIHSLRWLRDLDDDGGELPGRRRSVASTGKRVMSWVRRSSRVSTVATRSPDVAALAPEADGGSWATFRAP